MPCKQPTQCFERERFTISFVQEEVEMQRYCSLDNRVGNIFSSRQSRAAGSLCLVHRELGPLLSSVVLLIPAFFDELEKLRDAGVIVDKIVTCADTTFEVEWQGYTCNNEWTQLVRDIQGRWRLTLWPVALLIHCREKNKGYRRMHDEVNNELERRGLPKVTQTHVDGVAP